MKWRKHMMEYLDQDILDHIARETQDNIDRGMSPEEARYAAVRKFGNVTRVKEDTREVWSVVWLEQLLQDVRFALRMLRKSLGFTTVAILTLALGIGANTAILAVMTAVLQPKLPYAHPERIVDVYNRNLKVAWDYGEYVSVPLWQNWRAHNHTFDDLAAHSSSQYFNLSGAGEAARIRGARVSPNIFSVLGLQPFLGRGFSDNETAPGRDHVAILSYRLWKERFSGRADILNQKIHLSRENYTVIGVLPDNFQLGTLANLTDVFTPLDLSGPDSIRRDLRSVFVVGSLKPTVSLAAAQADLSAITDQLAKNYPATDGGWGANVISLHDDLVPFGSARFFIFLGLGVLVLLVACLNIAVLSSAQMESRKQEFLIRTVLGASRGRLLRQTMCESALLSVFGTVAALFLASWGTHLLIRYTPADFLNNVQDAPLSISAFGAAVGMCIFTMLIIGILPAMSGFSTSLNRRLGRGSSRIARSQRGYVLLIGGEIAIGLALLVGAGVLGRSLHAISKLDIGFDPRNVVSARITLDPAAYPSNASRVAFFNRLMADLRGHSGMSVSAGSALPLADTGWLDNVVSIPGAKSTNVASNDLSSCFSVFVYPGYFATLRTPILMGRDFAANEPDAVVVI
ncbi:MAG: ABC transporter permease, partial [Candidatus Acidiferrales bacterium]